MPASALEQLIDRVLHILGPDAQAEQVEQLVAACLDYAQKPHETPSGERVIITAFGCDRPGILAHLTQILYEAGVNILDVSQKILQDYFTLIMIADISRMEPTLKELQEQLVRMGEQLGIRVYVQHEELFNAMFRP